MIFQPLSAVDRPASVSEADWRLYLRARPTIGTLAAVGPETFLYRDAYLRTESGEAACLFLSAGELAPTLASRLWPPAPPAAATQSALADAIALFRAQQAERRAAQASEADAALASLLRSL